MGSLNSWTYFMSPRTRTTGNGEVDTLRDHRTKHEHIRLRAKVQQFLEVLHSLPSPYRAAGAAGDGARELPRIRLTPQSTKATSTATMITIIRSSSADCSSQAMAG